MRTLVRGRAVHQISEPTNNYEEQIDDSTETKKSNFKENEKQNDDVNSRDNSLSINESETDVKSNTDEECHLCQKVKDSPPLKKFIFDPDGDILYYWMAIVTLAVMYNICVIIPRLAFPEMRALLLYDGIFVYLDGLSDFIYLSDIIIQLRTAFLEDGIPVYDPIKLCQNYRRNRKFYMDIITLLPMTEIWRFLNEITQLTMPSTIETFNKAETYIALTRLPRLIKCYATFEFFEITDSRTSNPNRIRGVKLSLYLWIVIHWIACIFYMISEYEGLGVNEWVHPQDKVNLTLPFIRKYIRSFYWSTVTLTTIGGTAGPETCLEYVFTGLTYLIGVFVFAAVVGNVGDVIRNMNAARSEFQTRMDRIKLYMNHRKVPSLLQSRVKKWSDYCWNRTQAIDERNLLEILPKRLRTEIAIQVHLDTLKKVKIFERCEQGLLCELVLKLKPQIYSPGEYICRTGEIGREMYIINHGKVEVVVPDCENELESVVATLSTGNYFGEISLLKLDSGQNKRTADVRSIGYSELLCLFRADLMAALTEYPDAKKVLEAQARERMQRNRQVKRFSTTDSTDRHDSFDIEKDKHNKTLILGKTEARLKARDITELKYLIKEFREINKTARQCRVQHLSEKCDELQKQLQRRNQTLKQTMLRVAELEKQLKSSVPTNNRSNNCNYIHSKSQSNVTNSYIEIINGKNISNLCSTAEISHLKRRHFVRRKLKPSNVNIPGININDEIQQEPTSLMVEIFADGSSCENSPTFSPNQHFSFEDIYLRDVLNY